jgi:Holliday junction resolvasome RuvABC endonuclease subunit
VTGLPYASGGRVVGFDPGLASCGYALLELHEDRSNDRILSGGVWRTQARKGRLVHEDTARRALELAEHVREYLLATAPHVVCMEGLSLPRNAGAAAKAAMAHGVILAAAGPVPVETALPPDLKLAMTGRRSASKGDVIAAVRARWAPQVALPDWPTGMLEEHAADAAAVVAACFDRQTVRAARRVRTWWTGGEPGGHPPPVQG